MGPVRTLATQLATFMWLFAVVNCKRGRSLPPDCFDPYRREKRRGGGIPLTKKTLRAIARGLPRRRKKNRKRDEGEKP